MGKWAASLWRVAFKPKGRGSRMVKKGPIILILLVVVGLLSFHLIQHSPSPIKDGNKPPLNQGDRMASQDEEYHDGPENHPSMEGEIGSPSVAFHKDSRPQGEGEKGEALPKDPIEKKEPSPSLKPPVGEQEPEDTSPAKPDKPKLPPGEEEAPPSEPTPEEPGEDGDPPQEPEDPHRIYVERINKDSSFGPIIRGK